MPSRQWMSHLALACSIATLLPFGAGCQLIMDDIAVPDDDAGDALPTDAGADAGPDADADAAITAPMDAENSDSAEDASATDAAQEAGADPDAAPDASRDTGFPEPDPNGCDGAGEKTFYADGDEDGYGDPDMPWNGCEARKGYVDRAGDCHDGNADVHEGQTAFFSAPYQVPNTTDNSFDYDCNEREIGAPGQEPGIPCTGGGLLACSGGGYEPNPDRENLPRANPYCGSNIKLECPNILPPLTGGCGGDRITTSEYFTCN